MAISSQRGMADAALFLKHMASALSSHSTSLDFCRWIMEYRWPGFLGTFMKFCVMCLAVRWQHCYSLEDLVLQIRNGPNPEQRVILVGKDFWRSLVSPTHKAEPTLKSKPRGVVLETPFQWPHNVSAGRHRYTSETPPRIFLKLSAVPSTRYCPVTAVWIQSTSRHSGQLQCESCRFLLYFYFNHWAI